ncbi:ABC transporter substrate-binding protein [Fusibacter ferrireducens]|uniref:ABC transporter substrate-binding protein n=1 Tax=Fusibacter ferrireducens TaxID=2785058 RepID=A0ABR9ZP06_9FIRM|nr:ABC transporter substrate-binding protein [Fusibacter ferrireducens]MBF4692192.1 ABC transporter substrate-binding protein [Fusibacter ferrireducens]
MKKHIKKIVMILLTMFIFTSCSSGVKASNVANDENTADATNVSKKATRDTIVVALPKEPPTLDPHNEQSTVARTVEKVVYDRLVERTNGEIKPMLAKSWEILDDLTIRFHLRDDVYFHNGEKMTAEDVRYTIERAESMPASAYFFSSFDGKGTKVVDEYTIDIKLHNAFAPALNYLASSRGNIVCKKAVEEMGADAYGRAPIGTGPLKFSKWVSGDRIELVQNEAYWGNQTAYKKLVFRTIIDASSRAVELETGGIDISLDISPEDMGRLSENPDTRIVEGPGYAMNYFMINSLNFDTLADVKVREALAMALNTKQIVDAVFKGTARASDSVYPNTVDGYTQIGPMEYNPEKAKKMLVEAGWDFDTVLDIASASDEKALMDICEIAQNMWAEIGVKSKITSYETATLMDQQIAGKTLLSIAPDNPATGDPDHAVMSWYQAGLGLQDSQPIWDLIKEGRATYDKTARAAVYAKLQKLLWDSHGTIPVADLNVLYGTRSDIENMDVDPGKIPNLAYITISQQ